MIIPVHAAARGLEDAGRANQPTSSPYYSDFGLRDRATRIQDLPRAIREAIASSETAEDWEWVGVLLDEEQRRTSGGALSPRGTPCGQQDPWTVQVRAVLREHFDYCDARREGVEEYKKLIMRRGRHRA